jgi:restriction system protein
MALSACWEKEMSRSWLIRLGKFGEQESHALETGELATGWIIEDVMAAQSREEIAQAVESYSRKLVTA